MRELPIGGVGEVRLDAFKCVSAGFSKEEKCMSSQQDCGASALARDRSTGGGGEGGGGGGLKFCLKY